MNYNPARKEVLAAKGLFGNNIGNAEYGTFWQHRIILATKGHFGSKKGREVVSSTLLVGTGVVTRGGVKG